MKNFLFFGLFTLLSTASFSQKKILADDITGIWTSNLGKGRVEITKDSTGTKYQGKIIWLKVPTYPDGTIKLDKNNPDKTKQTDPLVGLIAVKNLSFVKDHWEGGTIYDPESGKTYSCRVTFKGANLEFRGYIGVSQIGRTQTWERYNGNSTTQNQ
jgi:uncharacterized protein (DUF2147 family)